MALLPFGEFLPDLPVFANPGATEAKNVIPRLVSYGPLPDLATLGSALTARAQGAISARSSSAVVNNFAGDATKLYKYNSGTTTWDDVSRLAGGAYATPAEDFVDFTVFGDDVLTVNNADVPQVYTMGSSSNFAALSGSPPVARCIATVRDFVFLGGIASAQNRVKWSGINNDVQWTVSAATMSDQQDLPEGGIVMRIVGGEYGVIFQERAIRRFTFIGPPPIFQNDPISNMVGIPASRAVARYQNMIFALSTDGFIRIDNGSDISQIGDQKVDRYFLSRLDQTTRHRITTAIDPINKLFVVSWPNDSNGATQLLFHHWPSGRWSRGEVTVEMIWDAVTDLGYTLDSLDTVSSSIDALPYSLDSIFWSGPGRIVLAAFDTAHKFCAFSGSALAATLETTEARLVNGGQALVTSFTPVVDDVSVLTGAIGTRDLSNAAVSWGSSVAQQADGRIPVRGNSAYHRARVGIAAGGTWSHALGVDDVQFSDMGTR